jgi:hypothetical protein
MSGAGERIAPLMADVALAIASQARRDLLTLQSDGGLNGGDALALIIHGYLAAALAMHRSACFERGLSTDAGPVRAAFEAAAAMPLHLVDGDSGRPITIN